MNKEEFIKELKKINIDISNNQLEQLDKFKELLKEYNQKFNLTTIIKDNDIYLKHFYDSLYLMTIKEFKRSSSILDIGVGAGFPSIPLAILNEDKEFTLIESSQKKCNFINIVKEKLSLSNITIINKRAEDFTRLNREKFDLATSRAVSHLKNLSELEIPALKTNGYFIPMKAEYEKELEESKEILSKLKSKIINKYEYFLPIENSKRSILVIQKLEKTNTLYPREYSKIIKETKNIK